jgi:hypothetical protein
MKNDMTWECTDNSEINKQQAARSHGNLVGLRSKTPFPIPHSPSPSPGTLADSQSKTPSSIIHNPSSIPNAKTISTLQRRKAYITNKLARMRAVPQQKKAWLYEEATALTRILHFLFVMLKTVPPDQLEKLRNLKAIEDGLLPDTQESVRLRDPGFPDALSGALAALRSPPDTK